MAWGKYEDRRPMSRKFWHQGLAVLGLDDFAVALCNTERTDGFVTEEMILKMAEHSGEAVDQVWIMVKKLVEIGRWHRTQDVRKCERCSKQLSDNGVIRVRVKGWYVHDFLEYNESAISVDRRREQDRERKVSSRNPSGIPPDSAGNPGGVQAVRVDKSRKELPPLPPTRGGGRKPSRTNGTAPRQVAAAKAAADKLDFQVKAAFTFGRRRAHDIPDQEHLHTDLGNFATDAEREQFMAGWRHERAHLEGSTK